MHLHDATEHASVHLFLRTLNFPFPARDLVGIPGNVIGLPDPYNEQESALLIHELEHISSLTFPIGTIFTALGLRTHDLRNIANSSYKNLMNDFEDPEASTAGKDDLENKALDVVVSVAHVAEFARRLITMMELMTPLLEGLALISEMEIDRVDVSWSWFSAVALEYLYIEHRTVIEDKDKYAPLLQEDVRKELVFRLTEGLEKQLQLSRRMRLEGDLLRSLFFKRTLSSQSSTAVPYFYGYLYLRKLLQYWSQHIPEMDYLSFFGIVSKLICSVIPMTLLPLYSLEEGVGFGISKQIPKLFKTLLEGFLHMDRADIQLVEEAKLLVWNFEKRRPMALPDIDDHASQRDIENRIFLEVLWNVFDIRNIPGEEAQTTLDLLPEIEEAKFLIPTAVRNVVLIGVDDKAHIVLLAEPSRIRAPETGKTRNIFTDGAAFFQFQDEHVYQKFLQIIDKPDDRFPRMTFGKAPYRVHNRTRLVTARLHTFCYFWPNGVPEPGQDRLKLAGSPVEVVRVLMCKHEDQYLSFISTSWQPVADAASILRIIRYRDFINNQLLKAISTALDVEYTNPRFILGEIQALFEGSPPGIAAENTLNEFRPEHLSDIQSVCRSVFSTVIFPRTTEHAQPTVSERKIDILEGLLSKEDMRLLRRWILGGLALTPQRSYNAADGPDDIHAIQSAIERIRTIALRELGIPLVSWAGGSSSVIFDLLPNAENAE